MLTKDLIDRAKLPLALYVDVLPYHIEDSGQAEFLLFRRRPDVVMPAVWQPACGKMKGGAGIADSFADQVQKKTGETEFQITPIDYLNSYYDHYYDAVMMVPCAGARLNTRKIKIDDSLHDAHAWMSYEEVCRRVKFRGQLAAYSILRDSLISKCS